MTRLDQTVARARADGCLRSTSPPWTSPDFAAVLGVNPLGHLLAARGVLSALPATVRQTITGREFFPDLISGPFARGLVVVFALATVLTGLAALASARRGKPRPDGSEPPAAPAAPAEGARGAAGARK